MSRAIPALILVYLTAAGGVLRAPTPEKKFVYYQATGKLRLDGKEIGSGYSGKAEGKNNPDKEKEKNIGPIPRGAYKIGKPKDWKGMHNVFDLTPDGHDAHGRTQLLIHGDSKKNPGNASEGCIILSSEVRKKVADSGITKLRVVKN
jgi:hypothetical protein